MRNIYRPQCPPQRVTQLQSQGSSENPVPCKARGARLDVTRETGSMRVHTDGDPQVRIFAAILCTVLISSAACASPNIVVILTDDQDDTGSMAYMPKTISLVAEHGITFTNSFVNLPLCAPSRASFLTGQSAHNHKIMSNQTNKGGGWQKLKDYEKNSYCLFGFRRRAMRQLSLANT